MIRIPQRGKNGKNVVEIFDGYLKNIDFQIVTRDSRKHHSVYDWAEKLCTQYNVCIEQETKAHLLLLSGAWSKTNHILETGHKQGIALLTISNISAEQ